jgi:hypothetical protein
MKRGVPAICLVLEPLAMRRPGHDHFAPDCAAPRLRQRGRHAGHPAGVLRNVIAHYPVTPRDRPAKKAGLVLEFQARAVELVLYDIFSEAYLGAPGDEFIRIGSLGLAAHRKHVPGFREAIRRVLAYLGQDGTGRCQDGQFIPQGIEFRVRNLRFPVVVKILVPDYRFLEFRNPGLRAFGCFHRHTASIECTRAL